MNLLSTELTSIGPLCQAAIVTFQPLSMGMQLLMYGMIFFTGIKVFASIAKAFLTFRTLSKSNHHFKAITTIAQKHGLPPNLITIINDSQLLAFSSIMPGISNGIFISKGACQKLTPLQLEAVVLHELQHWLQKDPLKQLGLKILSEVFFFLPTVRDVLNHWQLQAELSADTFAVKKLGSRLLLQRALARWLTDTTLTTTPLFAIAFAETQLNARIMNLNAQKNNRFSWSIFSRFIVSTIVLTALILAQTSRLAQAEAQIIIPTSPQCTQDWQKNTAQSSIFTVMSHQ